MVTRPLAGHVNTSRRPESTRGLDMSLTSSRTVSRTHSLGCHRRPSRPRWRPGLLHDEVCGSIFLRRGNLSFRDEEWRDQSVHFCLAESGRRILPLPLNIYAPPEGREWRTGRRWCVEEGNRKKKRYATSALSLAPLNQNIPEARMG